MAALGNLAVTPVVIALLVGLFLLERSLQRRERRERRLTADLTAPRTMSPVIDLRDRRVGSVGSSRAAHPAGSARRRSAA